MYNRYKLELANIYVFFILSSLLCSCSKEWLSEKSNNQLTVPASAEDLQAIMDNFNLFNSSTSIASTEIAADGHFYTEDDWVSILKGTTYENMYTWSNKNRYEFVGDWNSPYEAILNVNVVLDRLEYSSISNQISFNDIKGQALFNRARFYFYLAETYCPPYSTETSQTDPGLPLRLNTDIASPSKRSTASETYEQILKDLKSAKDLLKNERPKLITRASKPAALALLAKIYLSMEKYDSAWHYANECINANGKLIDYNTITQGNTFIGINSEVLFFNKYTDYSALTTSYYIDPELYNTYDDNDLRKTHFFQLIDGKATFIGTYGEMQYDVFCGLANDEVYLIRAESAARLGNLSHAMADLNTLLRTRWKNINNQTTYQDQTATNETDALTKILNERKKQLILRNVRWSDLRRLNKDDRFKVTITRTVEGQTYTLEPQSYKYTFPIPDDIISKTTLQQNSGWSR